VIHGKDESDSSGVNHSEALSMHKATKEDKKDR